MAYPRNHTDAYSGLSEQPEDAYIDFPQNYNSAPQYLSSSPDLDDLIELLELEDQRTSATTLRIPNSVVEINPELLKYCYDLVSITIGSQVKTVDASSGHYYVLKKDGNVYNFVVSKTHNSAAVVSSPVVYSRSNYDGEIIDFSYAGKTSGTSVRTTSEIFRMIATNKEECSKYVDVACEYEMQLDEGLTEHQNKILGFSGTYLITTYGKQFNAGA